MENVIDSNDRFLCAGAHEPFSFFSVRIKQIRDITNGPILQTFKYFCSFAGSVWSLTVCFSISDLKS